MELNLNEQEKTYLIQHLVAEIETSKVDSVNYSATSVAIIRGIIQKLESNG